MENQKNLIAGVVSGVVLGSALGTATILLFTTRIGAKLRRNMVEAFEDVSRKIQKPVQLKDLLAKNDIRNKLVLGGIAGGIIGISIGILVIPMASNDLRKFIVAKMNEAGDKTQILANNVAAQSHHALRDVGLQAVELTEKAKDFISVVSDGVNSLFNQVARK